MLDARLRFYLEIRYESLVLDTEATLRQVCAFIDLPWDPLMLQYHRIAEERMAELVAVDSRKEADIEERRGKHAWTSRPPEASRIGRWKTQMSASDRHEFESIAGGMPQELGYAGEAFHGS